MVNYPYNRPQLYTTEPLLKGRPVSSFEEARASMIDFDGTVFYFPDLANQKIYTKQINLDGTPCIKIYELSKQQIPMVQNPDLVTKKELEEAIAEIKKELAGGQASTTSEFKF